MAMMKAAQNQQNQTPGVDQFRQQLGKTNAQLNPIAENLISRGTGTAADPMIEQQRADTLNVERARLARMGITGSSAEDYLTKTSGTFDQSQLAGRDQALQSGINLKEGLLQNTAGSAALDIAKINAMNAGRSSGGGKGK
jgi:hypothetical protein